MFEQVLDTFRNATESTMQFQQEMMRQWAKQWDTLGSTSMTGTAPGTGTMTPVGGPSLEAYQAFQKQWSQLVTESLRKHREALHVQYEAGIKMIEQAFKVGEAKDVAEYRKLMEDLWRHSFESLESLAKDQIKEVEAAWSKWFQMCSKSFTGMKP